MARPYVTRPVTLFVVVPLTAVAGMLLLECWPWLSRRFSMRRTSISRISAAEGGDETFSDHESGTSAGREVLMRCGGTLAVAASAS